MTSQTNYIKTALRLPRQLHQDLSAAAEKNGRSLNAEILSRLSDDPALSVLDVLARQTADIRSMTKEILETVTNK